MDRRSVLKLLGAASVAGVAPVLPEPASAMVDVLGILRTMKVRTNVQSIRIVSDGAGFHKVPTFEILKGD